MRYTGTRTTTGETKVSLLPDAYRALGIALSPFTMTQRNDRIDDNSNYSLQIKDDFFSFPHRHNFSASTSVKSANERFKGNPLSRGSQVTGSGILEDEGGGWRR